MMKGVKRIAIVGGSGSGKSYLAKRLGEIFELPVVHMDALHWDAKKTLVKDKPSEWVARGREERDRMLQDVIASDKWVIDGTYTNTLEKRVRRADLVIFLDFSTLARTWSVAKRSFKGHGKEKDEIPGMIDRFYLSYIFGSHVFGWRKGKRYPEILRIFRENGWKGEREVELDSGARLMVLRNRRSVNEWLGEVEG